MATFSVALDDFPFLKFFLIIHQPYDQVFAAHFFEFFADSLVIFAFVPKEEEMLAFLVVGRLSGIYWLEGIGVQAGVIDYRSDRHRRWGKILDLLQFKAHILGFSGEVGHIFSSGTWVAGNEIRD